MSTKKDKLLASASPLEGRKQKFNKEDMAKKLKSPTSEYKSALIHLERKQIDYLNETVKQLNEETKRKVSKSELVRVAVDLLEKKNTDEILGIIRGL